MTEVAPDAATLVVVSVSVGGGVERAVDPGGGLAATALFSMFAEQMTKAPPPLVESFHWLIVTPRAEDSVPVAVQVSSTRVPPFAEPLHCVIEIFRIAREQDRIGDEIPTGSESIDDVDRRSDTG